MAMRVTAIRDFVGRGGAVVHKGEAIDLEDDAAAYNLIHDGNAEPPLRLRVAREGLVGRYCVAVGDLIDVEVDRVFLNGEDRRLERLAAVVRAGEVEAIAVKPAAALMIVAAGGRYATREEAEPLDLGGADRFEKPEPGLPTGPTERLFFMNGRRLADGRWVEPGTVAVVAAEEADELVGKRYAEPLVKVRAKRDGLAINVNCSAGDVVEVQKSIAGDRDRFERIGLAEKAAAKVVDVLGLAGVKAAEPIAPAEAAEKEEPAAKAPKPAGRRPVVELGPGDAK